MVCPVVLSFSNRKMTKEQWRYVWRAARIGYRQTQNELRQHMIDLVTYGTAVVRLP